MAKDHQQRALRYLAHQQLHLKHNSPNSRPTRLALAIHAMFSNGLPQGWGG